MLHRPLFLLASLAAHTSICAPAPTPSDSTHLSSNYSDHDRHDTDAWSAGAVDEFQIHPSCNNSETIQLRKGLEDAVILADHARQHILRYSNSSSHYQKYFGNAPSGQVVGWYDKIVNGDKGKALFRCDNPDGNCNLPKYGGHWRGSNATDETVICPLSFETRKPLEQLCGHGWTVAEGETNTYFGSDLIHRLYHMPAFGEHYVEHFTEDYADVLAIAKDNATYAIRDSDVLQYFALDVYAFDIVYPDVGCPGGNDTVAPEVASATVAASTTATSSVQGACHTHADGALHCE